MAATPLMCGDGSVRTGSPVSTSHSTIMASAPVSAVATSARSSVATTHEIGLRCPWRCVCVCVSWSYTTRVWPEA